MRSGIKFLLLFLLIFYSFRSQSQTFLQNRDFENFNNCPTNLGMINEAPPWQMVVQSADYYNCNLTTNPYISDSTSFSGTGYVGFASYGNINGAAEALGQDLIQPLLPSNSYTFSFAAKKAMTGIYSDVCGGVALYGFKTSLPLNLINDHLSLVPGSMLLGVSGIVQDSVWSIFSFSFTPVDTVSSIGITVDFVPNCGECIFLDYANLQVLKTGIDDITEMNSIKIFPNPFEDRITFNTGTNEKFELVLFNILSQEIYRESFSGTATINTSEIEKGIYFYELNHDNTTFSTGKVIRN